MTVSQERRIRSFDGVEIACSVTGRGITALVFIHGGMANRRFWAEQTSALSDQFYIVSLDLAGHYLMLERPGEFHQYLRDMVRQLDSVAG